MKGWPEVPIPPPAPPRPPLADGSAPGHVPPAFTVREPARTMRDLVVPAAVRHRIDLALSQVDNHEVLYRQWNAIPRPPLPAHR